LVPKSSRRIGGSLDEMIISLYAGGMTVHNVESHAATTLGVEVSRETISKITEGILEMVKAWQTRPLDPLYAIVYLNYPSALAAGWPIASGVIEGTCRYLVADQMDITGARWSVDGAEVVLKLRAVRAKDDFEEYRKFHLNNERHRVHETRYARTWS